jgi:hypothetical protein
MKKLNTQLFRIIWVLCSTNHNPTLRGECKNLTLSFGRKGGFNIIAREEKVLGGLAN